MIAVQLRAPDGRPVGRLSALQFSTDGRTLAAVSRFEANILTVAWWDLRRHEQTGADSGARIGEDNATPPDPALSPDLRLLARMENERGGVQRLVLVDRSAPKQREYRLTAWPYERPDDYQDDFSYQAFVALTFAPDGSHLYALVLGGSIKDDSDAGRLGVYRWHVPTVLHGRGKKSSGHLLPDPGFFLRTPQSDVFQWAKFGRPLVAGPDGRTLAAGFWNKWILGWTLPAGDPLPEMGVKKKRKQPMAWRLAFSPDGRTLAAADEAVTVYDTATGKPRFALPAGPAVSHPELPSRGPFVFDFAYDPASRLLATATGDPVVGWWDAATGDERARYDWDIGPVTAVVFSPDGLLFAAGGQDGRIAVWDVAG
jgi:WD40 repeat protein